MGLLSGIISTVAVIIIIALVVYIIVRKPGSQGDWQPDQIATTYQQIVNKITPVCPSNNIVATANCFVNYADIKWSFTDINNCLGLDTTKCNQSILSSAMNKLNNCGSQQGCTRIGLN